MIPTQITYEGLRELLQAFAITDRLLFEDLLVGLHKTGEVIRVAARHEFVAYGAGRPSFLQSAESFETRVRAGGAAHAIVFVGQRRRSSRDQLKRRPNYGGLQMKHGFLPARAAVLLEAEEVLVEEVMRPLKARGF